MKSARQLEALRVSSQKKKRETFDKTMRAIAQLVQQGHAITIPTVARAAGVSKVYLYKHPDLKHKIKELQANQQEKQQSPARPQPASSKSQATLIYHLRQKVNQLKQTNKELKKQIEVAYGQVAQFYELSDENQRLKQELQQAMSLLKQYQDQNKDLGSMVETDKSPHNNLTSIHIKHQPNVQIDHLSDVIRQGLKSIRVPKPTRQMKELIGARTEQEVLEAIAVVKEAIDAGTARSPSRYFISALQQGWEPNLLNELEQIPSELKQLNQWFDLARDKGIAVASTNQGGMIMIYGTDGVAKPLSWWLEKYPISDLLS